MNQIPKRRFEIGQEVYHQNQDGEIFVMRVLGASYLACKNNGVRNLICTEGLEWEWFYAVTLFGRSFSENELKPNKCIFNDEHGAMETRSYF